MPLKVRRMRLLRRSSRRRKRPGRRRGLTVPAPAGTRDEFTDHHNLRRDSIQLATPLPFRVVNAQIGLKLSPLNACRLSANGRTSGREHAPATVRAGRIPALPVRAYAHAVVLDLRPVCSAMRMIQSAL